MGGRGGRGGIMRAILGEVGVLRPGARVTLPKAAPTVQELVRRTETEAKRIVQDMAGGKRPINRGLLKDIIKANPDLKTQVDTMLRLMGKEPLE